MDDFLVFLLIVWVCSQACKHKDESRSEGFYEYNGSDYKDW